MTNKKALYTFLIFIASGCLDPYQPPDTNSILNYLVVDTFLNISGTSTVKLSRTVGLTENLKQTTESNALVDFEEENGKTFKLAESESGTYTLSQQGFDASKRYRINIHTTNGKDYQSDFATVQKSPPIDSVNWKINANNGVDIYVNSHDDENNTRFYRWTFEETWQYNSAFRSAFVFSIPKPKLRNDDIYNCWRTAASTNIIISNTTRLAKNLVTNLPLISIEQQSEKLSNTYSILVKQYASTKDAYEYWLQLQKETESLGTLFDPQPSQVKGNIHCMTDPTEPTFGYFEVGRFQEKRIFIMATNLKSPSSYATSFKDCIYDTLLIDNIPQFTGPYLLISSVTQAPPSPPIVIGYSYAFSSCVDCKSAGGISIKPSFWP